MKYIIVICLGFAVGVSPLRDSGLVKFIINITGG